MVANPLEQLSLRSVPNVEFNRYSPVTAILKAMPIQNGLFEHWKKIWFGQGCLILSPISRRLWMYGKKNIMRIILSHHQVTWRLMNTKDGFIHLPHKRETGGINNSQKMKSAFFDCFYVMVPLKKGVHYTFLIPCTQIKMCANIRTLSSSCCCPTTFAGFGVTSAAVAVITSKNTGNKNFLFIHDLHFSSVVYQLETMFSSSCNIWFQKNFRLNAAEAAKIFG